MMECQAMATFFDPALTKLVARKEPGHCGVHGDFLAVRRSDGHLSCPQCVLAHIAAESTLPLPKRGLARYWLPGGATHTPPALFAEASFDSYRCRVPEQQAVIATLRRYVQGFTPGVRPLLLCGGCGNGKTHLSIATVEALAAAGHRAAYIVLSELVRLMDPRTGDGTLADLSTYDLVVVDEVGTTADIAWQREQARAALFALVDSRYSRQLAVALVTNLAPQALNTDVGERTYDRLRGSLVLTFTWAGERGRV